MVRVINRDSQRIAEYGCRLIERHVVFGEILVRLSRIPFELHNSSLAGF